MYHRNMMLARSLLVVSNGIRLFAAARRQRGSRDFWMQTLFEHRRNTTGDLLEDMRNEGVRDTLKNFVRLNRDDFDHLLHLVRNRIAKKDTTMRKAISPLERLCITMRFLATGDSYESLSVLFRVSKSSISKIIPEVCDAIKDALHDYVKLPSTNTEWKEVATEFERKWNFPHVIGAIDGKHVSIIAPKNSGAEYYNYKNFYSIVLLGIVDANYNFMYADVGCQGRISDGGVLANSSIFGELENNNMNIPEPEVLSRQHTNNTRVPYVFLGDKAFALKHYMLTPFGGVPVRNSPQRIYNYRLSRARRTVENAFGILSNVYRVLRKPMLLEPTVAEKVVLATVYLHNFSRKRNSSQLYTPVGSIDQEIQGDTVNGSWRIDPPTSSMLPLAGIPRRSAAQIQQVRLYLAHEFITNYAIANQYRNQ
ncbi:putative nuclease HARBI1 [Anopheles funestus]|uniref:putative nuclease HARBI1 n=1 Tax=Anopheles funestus TaxID=62324 RepID=UPI0020C6FBEC|nr:putative nuclease HARBI1 [Anopheles funestus]